MEEIAYSLPTDGWNKALITACINGLTDETTRKILHRYVQGREEEGKTVEVSTVLSRARACMNETVKVSPDEVTEYRKSKEELMAESLRAQTKALEQITA